MRQQVERLDDLDLRRRGLDALDRLQGRLDAAAAATPERVGSALGALDAEFEALTNRASTRNSGQMYASRTLAYLDCMRDVQIDLGPRLRHELALTLPALLHGARWYVGRVFEALSAAVAELAARVGDGPLGPVLGSVIGMLAADPPEVAEVNSDLQRRWSTLFADPDVSTLVARAEALFADHRPAWPLAVYHSPDIQVAARDLAAVDAGRFLCVAGDFHPGNNTLGQGLFATRHPDRERFLSAIESDVGKHLYLIPPRSGGRMRARIMPAITRPSWLHVSPSPDDCMPEGYSVLAAGDLGITRGTVLGPDGSELGPLTDLVGTAMFVAAVQRYDPFPVEAHGPRITLSKTVLRRATWQVPAADGPRQPGEASRWARDTGLPRRVFMLSPLEHKPIYIDFESPVLTGIACRLLRRAAAEAPDRPARFTEMLPAADECWLADGEGQRYTSELRLVAVDLERRALRDGATQP